MDIDRDGDAGNGSGRRDGGDRRDDDRGRLVFFSFIKFGELFDRKEADIMVYCFM